ncbi:MAG: trypsin-like peptidase domain-containing protein [Clostridium sp.]|nr:trypsin-like peptidase domain-containing protein [Clostridium sp.]MCM1172982.1 trypsin-like peptidase domain-containing protein [Clostridium sp.]MCM1208482.1 trypsin-like peptidase domain-containing protein [Ruminococcus sp.]
MSNLVFEKTVNGINNTEEGIINKLRSDGLVDRQGNLKLDVIEGLKAIGEPDADDLRTAGADSVEQVIGTDTRTEVADKSVAPYKSIVLLIMKYGNDLYRGTGFLIKDNVVLTAAHNLYSLDLEKPADEVYIIGEPRDTAHIKTYTGLKVSVDYVSGGSQGGQHDWGLIKLNDAMTDLGTINVSRAASVSASVLDDVLIAGYPGVAQGRSTIDMWEADGSAQYYHASEVMDYTISTSGGNSGSPVMVYYGACRVAIGIHVLGSVNANYAKAIDDEVIAAINEFR